MNIGRSTGLLFLFVFSSILISAEGAESCEIELIQGCISNYKGILRGKSSPDQHCSRVQVNQLNLRRARWTFFVCLWINLPLDVVYQLPFKLANKVFTVGLLLDRVSFSCRFLCDFTRSFLPRHSYHFWLIQNRHFQVSTLSDTDCPYVNCSLGYFLWIFFFITGRCILLCQESFVQRAINKPLSPLDFARSNVRSQTKNLPRSELQKLKG